MSTRELLELWPRQFRAEMATKRVRAQQSLDALKNIGSEFYQAHELMIRIYDAAIAAVDLETSRSSHFQGVRDGGDTT